MFKKAGFLFKILAVKITSWLSAPTSIFNRHFSSISPTNITCTGKSYFLLTGLYSSVDKSGQYYPSRKTIVSAGKVFMLNSFHMYDILFTL